MFDDKDTVRPLATLGDIAHEHDDFSPDDLAPLTSFDGLAGDLLADIVAMIEDRPYRSAFVAVAVGILGGLLVEHANRPRRYSRGW
jgi:hypothetical protein